MDHRKDIGKLVKEHLANTEVEPNQELWAHIEKTLNEKQRRKGGILIFWSGIAFLLGIFIIIYFSYNSPEVENNEKNDIEIPVEKISTNTQKEQTIKIDSEFDSVSVQNEFETQNSSGSDRFGSSTIDILHRSTKSHKSLKGKNISKNYLTSNEELNLDNDQTSWKKSHSGEDDNFISQQESPLSTDVKADSKTNHKKPSVAEKLAKKKTSLIKDSVQDTVKSDRKLTIAQVDDEEQRKNDDPDRKLSVSIHAGPNAYRYLSGGSPFDGSLENGVLGTKISYSYSILLNIPLSEKFVFRLGFKNSTFKYYIDEATSRVPNNGISTIINDPAIQRSGNPPPDFLNSLNPPNLFRLDQEISYQSLPLQVLYRIGDGEVKIDGILGLNAMLLNKNSITLSNATSNHEIGSGKYIKKIALSSSIGLGFRYQLSNRLILDLEPTLQFQHGAFEKEYTNLNPVILNLNAGATIKL